MTTNDPPKDSLDAGSRARVVVAFPRGSAAGLSPQRREEITALFDSQYRRLVRFLRLRLGSVEEAQEIAQDTYLRLLERGAAAPDSNIRALLYVIARGFAIDRVRQRERHQRWRSDSAEDEGQDLRAQADELTPERIVSARQQVQIIEKLVAELPAKCRYAFIRYKFHGSEYSAIAADMGVTESMVRKYVIRAVSYCVGKLSRNGVEP